MKKLNICIREVKHGQFKNSLDIVLLDWYEDIYNSKLGSFGNVGSLGSGYCHSSGDYSYFVNSTKAADLNNQEVQGILKEFKSIYNNYEIVIKSRLTLKFAENYRINEANNLAISV